MDMMEDSGADMAMMSSNNEVGMMAMAPSMSVGCAMASAQ